MTSLESRLERAEKALRAIRENENSTARILVLVRHGLGEFTFSPTMPTFMGNVRAGIKADNAERSRRMVESN